jgi:hypothetical protein
LSTDGQLQDKQVAQASEEKTGPAKSNRRVLTKEEAFRAEVEKLRREYENRDR